VATRDDAKLAVPTVRERDADPVAVLARHEGVVRRRFRSARDPATGWVVGRDLDPGDRARAALHPDPTAQLVRSNTQRQLTRFGMNVLTAGNGEEASPCSIVRGASRSSSSI
jgi:hypothetical protein